MEEVLELMGQPVRLRIMAMLWRHEDLAATELRDHLGLTDGNLASHGKRLAQAGWVEVKKRLGPSGFQVRYRLLRPGARGFAAYLDWVQGLQR